MSRILLVDDNIDLSRLIHTTLGSHIYKTQSVFTVAQALKRLDEQRYDLLIVDRMLPDGDGLEIINYAQQLQAQMPILMISERNEPTDRVRGLQEGADDYLGKPFYTEELSLRVQKLLSKTKNMGDENLRLNEITLIPAKGILQVGKKRIPLRKREFQIFLFLLRHKNKVVTREILIENIWPDGDIPSFTTVDVYVRRIRILLGRRSHYLLTIRGYGYMIKE